MEIGREQIFGHSKRGAFSFNNTPVADKTKSILPNGKSEVTPDPLPTPASTDQPVANSTAPNSQSPEPLDKVREMAEKLKPGLRESLGKGQEFNSTLREGDYILNVRVETHPIRAGVEGFKELGITVGTPVRHMNVQLFRTTPLGNEQLYNKHIWLNVP